MNRVAYQAEKREFIADVVNNRFMAKMEAGAMAVHIGGGPSEVESWNHNSDKIRNLLEMSSVPDDVVVSFEYQVPTGGRIDCMLYGKGATGVDNVVHIELKQWSNSSVTEMYDNGVFRVDAYTGHHYQAVCHPSQQVANYQMHLLNYVEALKEPNMHLEGLAYCYNYSSTVDPHALYSNHYHIILQQNRLYSGNEVAELAVKLNALLCKGSGLEIFNRVIDSPIRQSKTLIEAAANMLKGKAEFTLLDDQIAASETIYAEVREAQARGGKTVIVIKGGPGTGKTVIALDVLARMANEGKRYNMYFTTRSKALRETLKLKLRNVKTGDGEITDASDLIANIFHFKPAWFKESEVDLLLVDEAHRVQRCANYMGDKFEDQTYLSQVMSLIYCAKVCVFFIDDKQAIKTEEIGNSEDICTAAEHYLQEVGDYEGSEFYAKLLKVKVKLQKALAERGALAVQGAASAQNVVEVRRIAALDEEIESMQSELRRKECCLHNVESHLTEPVRVIELQELKSQFRCNGSQNYLDWLDEVLYLPGAAVTTRFSPMEYDFEVFDSPEALYAKVREMDGTAAGTARMASVARLAAGYCWKWADELAPDGDLRKDVVVGDFAMPWETKDVQARGEFASRYASSADTWATEPAGINQVGCIFSIQGFEIDYIGVILGPDIKYEPPRMGLDGKPAGDCLVGVPGHNVAVPCSDPEIYTRHIRNAYRVLMSRGRRGCFVYATDPEVRAFLRRCRG
jgi:uncharacterized small protein (DUF1192 family)